MFICAECVNRLHGLNGVIESPNFPNKYPSSNNCSWIIDAPKGNTVNLTFSHFNLEAHDMSHNCTYDYLTIQEGDYDVPNEKHGTYCDSDTLPGPISSAQHQVFLNFITDKWFEFSGFRLEWVTVGCGGQLTRPFGEITSPNYPNVYPHNIECTWLIEVDYGHSVEINFTDVQTETQGQCSYDKVQLFGGADTDAPKLAEFCYATHPLKFTSTTNKLFIKFESDYTIAGRGFKANYKTIDRACGGTFLATQGVIHSTNYPLNYPHNQNCEWLIEVANNHVVNLTFTDFDIEHNANCTDDYVKVCTIMFIAWIDQKIPGLIFSTHYRREIYSKPQYRIY